ncbi:M48 family metallopeptidase [Arthrobacter sp. H5]|uniref:M48 metallopeptidase family protein n=1 Tax=Arthrobacter sp. H5 TaxID=1267973 RepID=UPI00047FF79F|nr:M48 family metallopeptidase [Arthrobacter sp. H5]
MTGNRGWDGAGAPVEVRRSTRRRRTVSADVRNGVTVVSIPAHFTAKQEKEWVEKMVAKLQAKRTVRPPEGAEPLRMRAEELADRFLDGRGKPQTIAWVTNQNSRWGSATPARRRIRLSHKLQGMPDWVVDYVILHEMAHLIESSHSPAFWALLSAYPRTETAKAFLEGAAFAADHGLSGR